MQTATSVTPLIHADHLFITPLDKAIRQAGGRGYNTSVRTIQGSTIVNMSAVYEFDTEKGPARLRTRNEIVLAEIDTPAVTIWKVFDLDQMALLQYSRSEGAALELELTIEPVNFEFSTLIQLCTEKHDGYYPLVMTEMIALLSAELGQCYGAGDNIKKLA